MARFAFGPTYFKEMKITELKPFERVKWVCMKGADEWIGTTLSFELVAGNKEPLLNRHPEIGDQVQQDKSGDAGTLLIFRHDDWKDHTPMYAECNYTWGRFLRSLKVWCETGQRDAMAQSTYY